MQLIRRRLQTGIHLKVSQTWRLESASNNRSKLIKKLRIAFEDAPYFRNTKRSRD
jgi:hypothetical protein